MISSAPRVVYPGQPQSGVPGRSTGGAGPHTAVGPRGGAAGVVRPGGVAHQRILQPRIGNIQRHQSHQRLAETPEYCT